MYQGLFEYLFDFCVICSSILVRGNKGTQDLCLLYY